MSKEIFNAWAQQIETSTKLDTGTLNEVALALRSVYPNAPDQPETVPDLTEGALHLVDGCLPGWSIALTGKAVEPNGYWKCTLRESANRDNDMVIGVGSGATVAAALISALLKAAAKMAHD